MNDFLPAQDLRRLRAGDFDWLVHGDYQDILFGPDGLRLKEWLHKGHAREVKRGIHRIVYRVELPGLVFYLKQNLLPDVRSKLRQMVRPSKARMEYNRALAVASRGLATVVPLALGERSAFLGGGESYLITHNLDHSEPLNVFLSEVPARLDLRQRNTLRRQLPVKLGQFLARIHEAGILHTDLHAENILIRYVSPTDLTLYLIDLNTVSIGQALDWPTSRDNLIMMNRWFIFRSSRTDRFRFWRAYCEERGRMGWQPMGPDVRSDFLLARFVEEGTFETMKHFCRRIDRRCLKNNRSCRRLISPNVEGFVAYAFDRNEAERLLNDPEEPFRRPDAKLLKDSPSSTVVEITAKINGMTRRVIYKRFRAKTWGEGVANLVRPSPAMRSWMFGHGFVNRSLPTPLPLVVLHRRNLGMNWDGYLMTEKIDNAQDLHSFLNSLNDLPPRDRLAKVRHGITQVARLMAEMHRCGYANRDPKASNWLVAQTEDDDRFAMQRDFGGLWIIDLVGISQHGKLPQGRRSKNLARLNASFFGSPNLTRTDRLRFLRGYLRWNLTGQEGWKRWWRAVEKLTEDKIARNIRRGRVLG